MTFRAPLPHRPRFCRHVPVAAALLALLSACSLFDKPGPAPVPTPAVVRSGLLKWVTVSDDRSGASVLLDASQELVVSLPVDAANRLDWTLEPPKPGVLALKSARFERALRSTDSNDAVGDMVWRFTPTAAGSVGLKFDLRRPRSLDPATRTVTFDVTVR